MAKLLVLKKDGTVHIREKSKEGLETLPDVHPNKIKSWLALAEASHDAVGSTMEDVIHAVIDEMKGVAFRDDKKRVPVTEEDYQMLLIQAANKGVSKNKVDSLVVIVAKKKLTAGEMVEEFVKNR